MNGWTGRPADPAATLVELEATVARVAEAMFSLDTNADALLLRQQDSAAGRADTVSSVAVRQADALWAAYPLLKSAVDELIEARKTRRLDDQHRLWSDGAITLADGTTTNVIALAARLEDDVTAVIEASTRLATQWRTVLPRVEAATLAMESMRSRANALGVTAEHEVTKAVDAVTALQFATATDPYTADPTAAEAAVEVAERRVALLESTRDGLRPALVAARRELAELLADIEAGPAELAATRAKVVDPIGLLAPVDVAAIEDGDRGLTDWLARIDALASTGAWMRAHAGLIGWRLVHGQWRTHVDAIRSANRAPLRARADLRGLLSAFKVKAGATGLAEDPEIQAAHDEAHRVLHTAPCDLGVATDLVHRYGRLVNGEVAT